MEGKKKGLLGRLLDSLDGKLVEKSSEGCGCCCQGEAKKKKTKGCCG